MSCLDLSVTTWSRSHLFRSWLQGSGSVNTASTSGKTFACLTFSPIPTIGSRMLRSIEMFVWRFVRLIRLVCTRSKQWWARETRTVWSSRDILLALFSWKFTLYQVQGYHVRSVSILGPFSRNECFRIDVARTSRAIQHNTLSRQQAVKNTVMYQQIVLFLIKLKDFCINNDCFLLRKLLAQLNRTLPM